MPCDRLKPALPTLPRLLAPSVAFVDLETTGANPVHDRVIEIGIVRITNGRLDHEWSSLVNPGATIPPIIQGVTGITNAMVRDAPAFEDIAEEVLSHLEGSIFVAHNARFDYGFLKNEFARLGLAFQPRVLCTVKFSRALYPEHHRHGLDALIARHNLSCDARHRALGDARVLWDFVQLAYAQKEPAKIEAAIAKAMKSPSLPSGLDRAVLDAVPEGPGVYLFYGESEQSPGGGHEPPLYIGKAVSMRSRVQAHFASDHAAGRAMRLAREVKRIEWIETAGELGALLKEAQLVKETSPIHNRHLQSSEELCSYRLRQAEAGELALELVAPRDMATGELGELYGLFKSKREATNTLRELAEAHGLCYRRIGLEQGRGPCFAHQIKRCRGVCVGKESAARHDLRLKTALAVIKMKTWPFPGRIAVRERCPELGRTDWHLFECWCYLGTATSEAELHEAAATRQAPAFDFDTYKMLKRVLERSAGSLDIVRLQGAENSKA